MMLPLCTIATFLGMSSRVHRVRVRVHGVRVHVHGVRVHVHVVCVYVRVHGVCVLYMYTFTL